MGNSGAEKTYHLNTLGNLFPILIQRVLTGYSIAYVNTWGPAPTPPPPPDRLTHILLLLRRVKNYVE